MDKIKAKFDGTSQWPINDWVTCLAKGGGPQNKFQYCLNPDSSKHFLYFGAIQVQEVISLILHCKTMYCCQRTSPSTSITSQMWVKYIQQSEVDWWWSLKRDRQSVFFHCSKPDGRWSKHGRNSMRLGQAKDRTIEKYLETSSKYSVLVQFKARSVERIAILSTTITRNRSQHTLPAICIEKAVCMKTHVYQSPRLPRVILKPNSQSGQQDQPDEEARKSSDHQSAWERSYGETRSGNIDYRMPAIPHSSVQQQDTNRKATVKKFIQQFENHANKGPFLQDLNKFSKESKKLITDMGNTETFELCETSSKKQCPDCDLYWESGVVYCSCGSCPTPSQSTKKLNKKNFDALSIPGYVIKKNLHRGAKHGSSERQRMYHKAKEMLQKDRQPKHGGYKTTLERCHNDDKYREDRSYITTRGKEIVSTQRRWRSGENQVDSNSGFLSHEHSHTDGTTARWQAAKHSDAEGQQASSDPRSRSESSSCVHRVACRSLGDAPMNQSTSRSTSRWSSRTPTTEALSIAHIAHMSSSRTSPASAQTLASLATHRTPWCTKKSFRLPFQVAIPIKPPDNNYPGFSEGFGHGLLIARLLSHLRVVDAHAVLGNTPILRSSRVKSLAALSLGSPDPERLVRIGTSHVIRLLWMGVGTSKSLVGPRQDGGCWREKQSPPGIIYCPVRPRSGLTDSVLFLNFAKKRSSLHVNVDGR